MQLIDWLKEREANARMIAAAKRGEDRAGWLEDAEFFRQAVDAAAAVKERAACLGCGCCQCKKAAA